MSLNTMFSHYIGQNNIKKVLTITLDAATKEKRSLPHTLFIGKRGQGKTTLAKLWADEYVKQMNSRIVYLPTGDQLVDVSDVINILSEISSSENSILFIDEIHSLSKKVQQLFYEPLTMFRFTTSRGGKTETYNLNKFCLIGATTEISSLTEPFIDRFNYIHTLDDYQELDIERIVGNYAKHHLALNVSSSVISQLAKRSKFNPRLAEQRVRAIRDFKISSGDELNDETVTSYFKKVDIDEIGLDSSDIKVLRYLAATGTVGERHLTDVTGLDYGMYNDFIEPYLIRMELILRTRSGRKITQKGLEILKIKKIIK